ncbi:MAG: division/cell wall cluster transcriptional repressor MraZ [Lactobacillus sp.]|jgi:MraZ protein|nr:division/cell wall cluster transcriptional repressor MraZ [Lactobacillus sp.]MCH3906489.1 division/cell wall cluster transcriptional repressor MraZ [Lactobacillus sp.]MCH3989933.1 division/cell wall cluster transcriptional repressor MraZ [Lactobacillus sp.]MCH4069352.1 division/cell wall cluster transcriptional repressor MraZ [Lactobacillus sp.]MCI1290044.1 division/cell wall cluster transcriptional repressor MraZ [Lactobacillus sp.]
MFMGEYHHNLDAKGRLIIPAKFRDQVGTKMVFTRGMEGCIFGYSEAEWDKIEARLANLPLTKRSARKFTRLFYSGAMESEFDKQGRVNLTTTLKKHAELEKECVIVGVYNRIEIWSQQRWESYEAEANENYDDIAEDLDDMEF